MPFPDVVFPMQGQIEAALTDYNACLRGDPRHCRALYSRARLLERLGRYVLLPLNPESHLLSGTGVETWRLVLVWRRHMSTDSC